MRAENIIIWYFPSILILSDNMNFKLREGEDYIKLGQLLKACNMVSSGVEAKIAILEEKVSVNSEICTMRGKKIHKGDMVSYKNCEVVII